MDAKKYSSIQTSVAAALNSLSSQSFVKRPTVLNKLNPSPKEHNREIN
jgi:hypothetical protein